MEDSVQMKLNIKREINLLLRRFVLEHPMKNKEIAINYILGNFLFEFYKVNKEEKKNGWNNKRNRYPNLY